MARLCVGHRVGARSSAHATLAFADVRSHMVQPDALGSRRRAAGVHLERGSLIAGVAGQPTNWPLVGAPHLLGAYAVLADIGGEPLDGAEDRIGLAQLGAASSAAQSIEIRKL
ncbi:MAG: hypothetical protein ABS78_19210 [Phenylobacterium sp. SCN 70-31]|nr:MAG: hypothetical protein ABS78_19210 [Phenylobacterium sp. SCN 70-31]